MEPKEVELKRFFLSNTEVLSFLCLSSSSTFSSETFFLLGVLWGGQFGGWGEHHLSGTIECLSGCVSSDSLCVIEVLNAGVLKRHVCEFFEALQGPFPSRTSNWCSDKAPLTSAELWQSVP